MKRDFGIAHGKRNDDGEGLHLPSFILVTFVGTLIFCILMLARDWIVSLFIGS
jgi:hypothetical protein